MQRRAFCHRLDLLPALPRPWSASSSARAPARLRPPCSIRVHPEVPTIVPPTAGAIATPHTTSATLVVLAAGWNLPIHQCLAVPRQGSRRRLSESLITPDASVSFVMEWRPPLMDNREIVSEFIEVVLNRGEIDYAGRFFWEDMVEQVPLPGQGPGLNGLKDVLRGMRAAFPDLHWTIEEQISEGDKVVTRFEWTGTHRAEFLGVPATGRTVKVWGIVIDRLEGGKIKDTRIIMDALGLMMQLGAFPPPQA